MINFLLSTEIIPLCLRIMETGPRLPCTLFSLVHVVTLRSWIGLELSKTVATFIVQKILLDEMGVIPCAR